MMTVGELRYLLSRHSDDAVVMLAMQPSWPLEYNVGEDAVVEVNGTVYIGESELASNDYLSKEVSDALGW